MNEIVSHRKKPKIVREIIAIITIAARDIRIVFKSPGTIIMSVSMPLVMMGLLGGSLAQNMAGSLEFNYGQFMLVGMLVNMLFMFTVMGMTSLVEDRITDFTQEILVSPVSRYSIIIGKIFGSSFGAIISIVGTLIVGLIMGYSLTPIQLLLVLSLSPLVCLSAGAVSMLILGFIKNNRTAQIAVMLIVMPQMFLSGAIIPINHSSGILLILNRILPMTYCLDLVRAVVYAGTPDYNSVVLFNPIVNCIVIIALTAVFLIIGTFFFARSEKNR